MKPSPQRTLKRVVDLRTLQTITSDQLLRVGADQYQDIRRTATRARNEGVDVFVCERCGHACYAPREPKTRLPFWRHRKAAPRDCPWWTGDPRSIDSVSATQFQGAQESPLHLRLKQVVAELLELDPLTEPGSVVVDRYLLSETGRRRPDVRATYDGKPIAIEIQLATTQIPIIVARESFYERERRHLIWLTWQFEPVERSKMLTAFEDIFYSHNKNLFSLDDQVITQSRSSRSLHIRAFWEVDQGWQSTLIELAKLNWPSTGLPFAVAPRPAWHLDFRSRWLAATTEVGTPRSERIVLLNELAATIDQDGLTGELLGEADYDNLLNCILSFVQKKPVGSRQHNLAELINTFLAVDRRHGFARLLRRVLTVTDAGYLFERKSVRDKFVAAEAEIQDGPETLTGRIALLLFPELFA